jgi:hypothetical protein
MVPSGQYVYATSSSGLIYYSSTYGQSWVASNSLSASWSSICADASGQFAVAVTTSGAIYYSTTYALNWIVVQTISGLTKICISSLGQYLLGIASSGVLYQSVTRFPPQMITNQSTVTSTGLSILAPNLTTTTTNGIVVGQALSNNNYATIGFNYIGTGSTSNYLSLGTTADASLCILPSGNVGIGSTAPAYLLDLGSGTIGCGAVNTASVTTKGTGNLTVATQSTGTLTLNSQGGALALQSGGVTQLSISANIINVPATNGIASSAIYPYTSGDDFQIGQGTSGYNTLYTKNSNTGILPTAGYGSQSVSLGWTYANVGEISFINNWGNNTGTIGGFNFYNRTGSTTTSFLASLSGSGLTIANGNITTTSTMTLVSGGGNINLSPNGSGATSFNTSSGTVSVGYINNDGFTINLSRYVAYNNVGNANTWYCFNGGATINAYSLQQGGGNLYELRYANSTGIFTVGSDRNLKKNIEAIEPILDKYLQLKPSYFHYKLQEDETTDKSLGLIAQEVVELFNNKNIVSQNEKGIYSLDYGNFTILTIKAVQEQHEIIVAQATRIDTQQIKIDAQQTEIVDLKAQLALKASESVVVAQQTEIVDLKAQLLALKAVVDALVASR